MTVIFNKVRFKFKNSIFLQNTGYLLVLQVAKYVFPFLTLPYLSRVLGPDKYAVRAYVMSLMVFIQVLVDFGFNQSGTKYVAEHSKDIMRLMKVNSAVLLAKFALSVCAGLLLFLIGRFIPLVYHNPVYTVFAFLSTCIVAYIPDFILQGLEDMTAITKRFCITQFLSVIAIFMFVKNDSSLLLVPFFELLGALIAFLWTIVYINKEHGIKFINVSCNDVTNAISNSVHFFIAVGSSAMMSQVITVFMGFAPINNSLISVWSISISILRGYQSILQPVSKSLYPRMVKTKDIVLLKKVVVYGGVIIIFMTLISIVGAPILIKLICGESYVNDAWILKRLLICLPFTFFITIAGYPLLGVFGYIEKLSLSILLTGVYQLISVSLLIAVGMFDIHTAIVVRITSEIILSICVFYYSNKIPNFKNIVFSFKRW